MKRTGFTLAEVLITLGVIGIIAALTIPMLSNNANDQANASKLSAAVSDFSNAIGIMMLDKDADTVSEAVNGSSLNAELGPYLKSGNVGFFNHAGAPGNRYTMKAGAVIYHENREGNLWIDVNGNEPPNREGKDLFKFTLNPNGELTPVGDATINLVNHGYKIKDDE